VTPAAVLDAVANVGGEVVEEGGRVVYRAPAGALTPALRAALRENKAGILEVLRRGWSPESAPAALFESSPESAGISSAVQIAPPATSTTALCAWLRSLRLPVEPINISPRWAPSRPQAPPPVPTAPPYCLDLADCLERIGAGTGTAADAARVLAWLPQGTHSAHIAHSGESGRLFRRKTAT